MTSVRPKTYELAERSSSGTQVRLLWRRDTHRIWVEVRENDTDGALAIPVPPDRALDAFRHPYAYAGSRHLPLSAEPSVALESLPPAHGEP